MSICDGASYTCGATKDGTVGSSDKTTITQTRDRVLTLTVGDKTFNINKRTRSYEYKDAESVTRSGMRFIYSATIQNAIFECFTQATTTTSSIDEKYTTVDCTFHYVDLRNDNIVYTESTQEMTFSKTVKDRINARTSFNDALLYPYILESVPIKITNKIMCTKFDTPLHEETIDSGYWNGIRVLMPLFNGNAEPYGTFTQDGVSYDAKLVDWYYLPNHRAADGDEFFWWADWHKAVGVHNEIDAKEATTMWEEVLGSVSNPYTLPVSDPVKESDFYGSSAIDRNGNVFFSAQFDVANGQIVLVSKLKVAGEEVEIPTDAESDVWFPIAPL